MKWQYTWVPINVPGGEDVLKEMGELGWEAYSAVWTGEGVRVFLKRQIK